MKFKWHTWLEVIAVIAAGVVIFDLLQASNNAINNAQNSINQTTQALVVGAGLAALIVVVNWLFTLLPVAAAA